MLQEGQDTDEATTQGWSQDGEETGRGAKRIPPSYVGVVEFVPGSIASTVAHLVPKGRKMEGQGCSERDDEGKGRILGG